MPLREIPIFKPFKLYDPILKAESTSVVDFELILDRLFSHPLWNDSVAAGLAQLSIRKAFDVAIKHKADAFKIAESDWRFLVAAASEPKTMQLIQKQTATGEIVTAAEVKSGLGWLPQMASQIAPLLQSIIDAKADTELKAVPDSAG